jgi:hypothetical protein
LSKSGLSKLSTGMKGLSAGNKIQHVPTGLESYTPFIQCQNSVGWIDWQTKGYEFAELSDNCPFCTSHAADKKDQIKKVGQEYDKNTIKNLIGIIAVIKKLGDYFSDEAKGKLTAITVLKDGIEKEHNVLRRSCILMRAGSAKAIAEHQSYDFITCQIRQFFTTSVFCQSVHAEKA